MKTTLLDQIAEAVLYEGYILYPYRPGTAKNRRRFIFGRVYPEHYSRAQKGAEPCLMQTQCLLRAGKPDAAVDIQVRFLHLLVRDIGALPAPIPNWPAAREPEFDTVAELEVDGTLYQSWQEAVERRVPVTFRPYATKTVSVPFSFPGSRTLEPIYGRHGRIDAVIARNQEALEGMVELKSSAVDSEVFRITVRILNRTPVPECMIADPDAVLMRTFASTHTVFTARQAEFFSLTDPPPAYREAAAQTQNIQTWPVLVGNENPPDRTSMLSSPIILPDYPKIAPESAGSLFDGTEIDEILTLRILTLTDEEKRSVRAADEHARRMLERTENLPEERMRGMHGTWRGMHSPEQEIFGTSARVESVVSGRAVLKAGDRVRIRPKVRADIMDLALAGKTAIIEALEQDAEGKVHLALVLPHDPGCDLGLMRQPGHRFFYGVDEIEPLNEGS